MVVHCSAGVGRSGVLVLVDMLMGQYDSGEVCDAMTNLCHAQFVPHPPCISDLIMMINNGEVHTLYCTIQLQGVISSVVLLQEIHIPTALQSLRHQRMHMVQTLGQYKFVYEVLIHYIKTARLI